MIYNIPYIAVVAMIFIGLYAVLFKRNLVKMVIGISIIESGVNLFLITLGYRWYGDAEAVVPIFTGAPSEVANNAPGSHRILSSLVTGPQGPPDAPDSTPPGPPDKVWG